MQQQHELMNVKEAATYLRLNYMTVYKLAQKGRLPAFKVGGNWRFKREILDDWLMRKAVAGRATVLVVDDDESVRDILKEIIHREGYSVVTAESGGDAVREIGRIRFDLVFLDLVLPDMSGIDVLKTIKEKSRDTVVVIVTGYADDPIALKVMSQGPLLLVRKPFRENDIIEVLNMVVRGSASLGR